MNKVFEQFGFHRLTIQITGIAVIVLMLICSSVGQTKSPDCFEVKHLDFFGLDKVEFARPDSEIEGLLKSENIQPEHKTSFLIPMIVKQLAEYHSCVKKRTDLERYNKLTALYLQIRRELTNTFNAISFTDQRLELIRKDFYDQVNDNELLPQMIYSMDDGPLTGEDTKSLPKNDKASVITTRFGKMKLIQGKERIYAGAFDKNEKPIWIKVLKGTIPERYLKNFQPEKIELNEFEAVGILTLFADGERLKIYVRPDGRFMFYTHSW